VEFANRFVANFLGGQIRRLRFFLGVLGVMGLATGLWSIYSGTVHSANGVEASAVLLERADRCKAEFQIKGESRSNVAMPCEEAYALLKMAGSKKVRVTKKTFATVRYPMADGSERTATVERAPFRRERCRSAAASMRSTIRKTRPTCVPSSAWHR